MIGYLPFTHHKTNHESNDPLMCGKGLENTTLSYGGGYLPRLVCYGACSNFSCKMSLWPAPVISWLKNNAFHNKKL